MARVSISLGSNIQRERNLRHAVDALRQRYPQLVVSPVYETEAVGFEGDDFLNLVVAFETDDTVQEVARQLKQIEDGIGRDRSQPRFSARTIDLDLLTYDQAVIDEQGIQIPRNEILKNAFVLKPMSDILGDERHPALGKSYRELWLDMAPTAGRITVFDLRFD